MKRTVALALATFALFALRRDARADVSIGSNLGFGVDFVDGQRDRFVFAAPLGSWFSIRPGFRVGFTGDVGRHEGFIDTSTAFVDRGDSLTFATGNYQYNFRPRSPNTFFLTAGGGFIWWGRDDAPDLVAAVVGGGLGLRQRLSGGANTLREELRLDVQPERDRFRPTTVMLSIRFGFDVWFR